MQGGREPGRRRLFDSNAEAATIRHDLSGIDTSHRSGSAAQGRGTGDPGDSVFTAVHPWGSCCTNGWAIGTLDRGWEAFVEFTATPNGIDIWRAYSGTGADVPLVREPDRRVRLMPIGCAAAFWQNYGKGWPGTNGVPGFAALDDPVLGTELELAIGNSAGATTSAAVFFGVSPIAVQTPFGATCATSTPEPRPPARAA